MTLQLGSTGPEVVKLQKRLIELGYLAGGYGADGSFGPATEAAVEAFQFSFGLIVDGIYGPSSQAKMNQVIEKIKYKISLCNRDMEQVVQLDFDKVIDPVAIEDAKEKNELHFSYSINETTSMNNTWRPYVGKKWSEVAN